MPCDLVYTVDGGQVQQEYQRGISISDSVKGAYKAAREKQILMSSKNQNYRDKGRRGHLCKW